MKYKKIIDFKINEDTVDKEIIDEVIILLKEYLNTNLIFDYHASRDIKNFSGIYLEIFNDYVGCMEFNNGIELKRYRYEWEEIKEVAKKLTK